VNNLFRDELKREGGIHSLQLKTSTPDEYNKSEVSSKKSVETTIEAAINEPIGDTISSRGEASTKEQV
jgi:hypothetical protein